MKGEMIRNNEKIKLQERDKICIGEIIIQQITKNDILYQIWLKGKYAQDHVMAKILEIEEKIKI